MIKTFIHITSSDVLQMAKHFLLKIYETESEEVKDYYQANIDRLRYFMTQDQKREYHGFEDKLIRQRMQSETYQPPPAC